MSTSEDISCISISLSNEYGGYLQHRRRRNTMRQQIIKSFPNLQYPRRRSLCYYVIRNHRDERLPIRWRNGSFVGYFLTASSPILASSHQTAHGGTHFWAYIASNISKARLKFRPLSFAILIFSASEGAQFSFAAADLSTAQISVSDGAATRTRSVRDLIGAMIFDVLFASNMSRRLGLYFSIVRRRAACASRVRWSASLITTTLNRCRADWSTCWVWATSFKSSCTTTRS